MRNTRAFLVILILLFSLSLVYAQEAHSPELREILRRVEDVYDQIGITSIINAYYPSPLTKYEWHNNDVRFLIRNQWIYYAHGRLLTEEKLASVDNYRTIMYRYRLGRLKDIFSTISAPIERLNQIPRSTDLQRILTEGMPKSNKQKVFTFFGKPVSLHPIAGKALKRVEINLTNIMRDDPSIAPFIATIEKISGYANRNVASSVNVSMHAFGLALDIIPDSFDGKDVYWLWTKRNNPQRVHPAKFEQRWIIPSSIVQVFEEHGFIWGGKWRNYDSIHFEYRPEILIYSRKLQELSDEG